jgi:hypothetical protein
LGGGLGATSLYAKINERVNMSNYFTFSHLKIKDRKILNLISRIVFLTLLIAIPQSCDSPTSVVDDQNFDDSFTPLKVGIEKQYFYYSDSSYQNSRISGIAFREDGQKVFIEESNLSEDPNNIHSSYEFIRDGFLYLTSLNKSEYLNQNPYREIRIAKTYAQNGNTWFLIQNEPDSTNILYTAIDIGDLTTPAGTFNNVMSMQYISYSFGFPDTVNVYYAKGIGNIGSSSHSGLVLVNYVKIDNMEYGSQVPIAILPKK